MNRLLISSLLLTACTISLFGVLYPIAIWGIAQVAAPNKGSGEIIEQNGQLAGFTLIGQSFTSDNYFNSRPSAVDYNAASTGGSNKGPTNPDYLAEVQARIDTFLAHNPDVTKEQVPVELVTASGGGLEPHLSPEAAAVQIPRIAKTRNISPQQLQELVAQHTQSPLLGMMGTSTVNVLQLNLALDELK